MPARFKPPLLVFALLATGASAETGTIIVTGSLRDGASLEDTAASVAVLEESDISGVAIQHFEELLAHVPNLGTSGEGSRARYLQVRGVGELEQYEGAPNAAVGFLIDDIDFSGLGAVATTFDVERVEVLRGPQGTRYGASALGGLIYLRSIAPAATPELLLRADAGSDGLFTAGLAAGGPVSGQGDRLTWRATAQHARSDGFRRNDFLGEDDSNGRDELTLRTRLRWQDGAGRQLDLVAMHVDLDNGYDAWSPGGGQVTYSDEPGRDAQTSNAVALRYTGVAGDDWQLTGIATVAETDMDFAFDADWGNDALWAPHVYRYRQDTRRERRTWTQEWRLASVPEQGRPALLAGAWFQRLAEDNRVIDFGLGDVDDAFCAEPGSPYESWWCDPYPTDRRLESVFRADTVAVFGEAEWPLTAATRLLAGARLERRSARYSDEAEDLIAGTASGARFAPLDRLWGGQLALLHAAGANDDLYLRIARGFRASGFNPGLARFEPDEDQVDYDDERLIAWEGGWRHAGRDGSWRSGVHAFWQTRHDMQVKVPLQYREGDPNTFLFLTDNAEAAHSLGIEAGFERQFADGWFLAATAAWLRTEIERFSAAQGSSPWLVGSEFPHAPRASYAFAVGRDVPRGWFGRLDLAGRGSYRYDYDASTGDDRREPDVLLANARAGFRWSGFEIEAWVRNLLDEEYGTRGFYFGNEPPEYSARRYVRAGDSRQAGIGLGWRFESR